MATYIKKQSLTSGCMCLCVRVCVYPHMCTHVVRLCGCLLVSDRVSATDMKMLKCSSALHKTAEYLPITPRRLLHILD